jgi:hypothetical protein
MKYTSRFIDIRGISKAYSSIFGKNIILTVFLFSRMQSSEVHRSEVITYLGSLQAYENIVGFLAKS